MWSLRVLSGNQAGETFVLKSGRNLIGRGPKCDVRITGAGVSKEHCEVHVYPDKVMLTDLNSSNGSYINGVKTQNGIIRLGDKISVHDIILDITPVIEPKVSKPTSLPVAPKGDSHAIPNVPSMGQPHYPVVPQPMIPQPHQPSAVGLYNGNAAYQMQPVQQPMFNPGMPQNPMFQQQVQPTLHPQVAYAEPSLGEKINTYFDNVFMPGIYKLAALMEFRYVLLSFVMAYIFVVTFLSMVPMLKVMRASTEMEAGRRVKTLAKTLSEHNRQKYAAGEYNNLSTQPVETEDGVKLAMIVQVADGLIVAPGTKAGATANIPRIKDILKESKISFTKIDDQTMTGFAPIGVYDPVQGEVVIKAMAIVSYDMSGMKLDSGRIISMFMQTLLISLIVGLILYFIMFKMIEWPLVHLNRQIDTAMRDKKDRTETEYLFEPLQDLVNHVNTLLTRYIHSSGGNELKNAATLNRDGEMELTAQMLKQAVLFTSAEGKIVTCNAKFEEIAGLMKDQIVGAPVNSLPDSALAQNLEFLMNKCREVPAVVHSDSLEFSQFKCAISCHAISEGGDISYFFFTFVKEGEG